MCKKLVVIAVVVGLLAALAPLGVVGASGDIASHVVISEVQIAGVDADDEFIELYNPTGTPISLEGWRLSKKTSGGSESNLLTAFPATSIPSHGFCLVVHKTGYQGLVTEDAKYSTAQSIAANSTVILYSDAGSTVVDKVGFGSASDYEGSPYADNPTANASLQRKSGDGDEYGPAYDTGMNVDDFYIRAPSYPQSSASAPVEPVPELRTFVLFSVGLIGIASVVLFRRKRVMVFSRMK